MQGKENKKIWWRKETSRLCQEILSGNFLNIILNKNLISYYNKKFNNLSQDINSGKSKEWTRIIIFI